MRISTDRMFIFASLFLLATALLVTYQLYLCEMNKYVGFYMFPIDFDWFVSVAAALFLIGMLMPTRIMKPSDFFPFFYGLFVLLPCAVLYQIGGKIDSVDFVVRFVVLVLPVLAIHLTAFVAPPLRVGGQISQENLTGILVLLCSIGIAMAFVYAPSSAGFDMVSSYERRLEGRDIFVSGSPLAYLNAMVANGFAPCLAFLAGWRRRIHWFIFAFICVGVYYFVLGLKAPILYVFLAASFGYAVRVDRIRAVNRTIYMILLGIFAVSLLEYGLFEYSYIGDYFIRRVFCVPSHLVSGYFDLMMPSSGASWASWTPFNGVGNDAGNITFMVGARMFPLWKATNANTNTFVQQLAAGGILSYAATILLVAGVFALLDGVYASKRNPVLLYIGFGYGILLPEQTATTALVSSGIGLLIMLAVFSNSEMRLKDRRLGSSHA